MTKLFSHKTRVNLTPILTFFAVFFISLSQAAFATDGGAETEDLMNMDINDLLNMEVTTASNRSEKLSEAPATMVVVTKEQISERGYKEFSDILEELPGMDIIKNYGDDYVMNYWRGYRNTISASYLIMIDGVIFNDLYFSSAQIMAAFPLSNIDRVEVVYGPASAVYGADAFMGVINVITKSDNSEDGSSVAGNMTYGTNERAIGDICSFYKNNKLRISATGRFENGNLRSDNAYNNFEYTKDKYYSDKSLWGGFTDNENLGGKFSSPIQNRALNLRSFYGNTELSLQYYSLNSGYGYTYPGDKAQAAPLWTRNAYNGYLRHSQQFSDKISATSMIRYYQTLIPSTSYYVENSGGYVDYSYWYLRNSSITGSSDIELKLLQNLDLLLGFKYEGKDLQKAYDPDYSNYGPSVLPDSADPSTYKYPDPSDAEQYANRIFTDEKGGYLLAKYRLVDNHIAHFGVRVDNNSEYGTVSTFRGAYIAKLLEQLSVKALFGQGYKAPTPRLIFGGWSGSGGDPKLKPEKSQTEELDITFTNKFLNVTASTYFIQNTNTILTTADGARNVGKRNIYGVDLFANALFNVSLRFLDKIKLWGDISYINGRGDEIFNKSLDTYSEGEIGDIADFKAWLGTTVVMNKYLSATLKGRYIGPRATVETNPIAEIDGYFLMDGNLKVNITKNLGVDLSINNIFSKKYFQPGTREANSGDSTGVWNAGVWNGSNGWYNSLIPQAERIISGSLTFNF